MRNTYVFTFFLALPLATFASVFADQENARIFNENFVACKVGEAEKIAASAAIKRFPEYELSIIVDRSMFETVVIDENKIELVRPFHLPEIKTERRSSIIYSNALHTVMIKPVILVWLDSGCEIKRTTMEFWN